MLRGTFFDVVVVCLLSVARSCTGAEPQTPDELQGAWIVVELFEGGKKVAAEEIAMQIEFKKGNVIVSRKGSTLYKGTYSIDPAKSPPTIDLVFPFDKETDTLPAIYRVSEGSLHLCQAHHRSGKRPDKFESTPATDLTVMKRQK